MLDYLDITKPIYRNLKVKNLKKKKNLEVKWMSIS